jgi:hypothetical protein
MGRKKKVQCQIIDEGIEVKDVKLSKKKMMERERELKSKQLPNVPSSKKLRPIVIHRIVHHTDTSIRGKVHILIFISKTKRK